MERFKKIYPFLLLFLLPVVGMDFGNHFLFLLTPMFFLSWGFFLCPFYTGVISAIYHHELTEFVFLYQGNMIFNILKPGMEGLNQWGGNVLEILTSIISLGGLIKPLNIFGYEFLLIGIKVYEIALWVVFTLGLVIIFARLASQNPEKKAMKKEKAYKLCNFILKFFLPYEILFAIAGKLSVVGRIYVIMIALAIIAHLVYLRIEKKKKA